MLARFLHTLVSYILASYILASSKHFLVTACFVDCWRLRYLNKTCQGLSMPFCILVIWALASSGLAKVDKDMKRKIMIGGVGVSVFFSLLVVHFMGMPYTWFRRSPDTNDTELAPTNLPSVSSYMPLEPTSPPITHIAYIKTHKTGSSTIWSMLVTYALYNNLTIAIPASKQGNKLGWPNSFTPGVAVPPKPDLLCYHSRFSSAMLDYMPEDTVYLTSLRDPATQLMSAFDYFSADKCFNMSFVQFLNTPDKDKLAFWSKCSDYFKWWLMNGQMYDLGLDTTLLSSTNPIHRQQVLTKIDELDKRFKLVLILENLDESLIVMRDMLHWTTEDIIYFRKNFQLGDKEKSVYTAQQQSIARKWNWADDLVYTHFKEKLEQKLGEQPDYYKQEVAELKHRASLWMTRCVRKVIPAAQSDNQLMNSGYDDNIGTYLLTVKGRLNNRCIRLATTEVSKVRLLNNGSSINVQSFEQARIKDSGIKWR